MDFALIYSWKTKKTGDVIQQRKRIEDSLTKYSNYLNDKIGELIPEEYKNDLNPSVRSLLCTPAEKGNEEIITNYWGILGCIALLGIRNFAQRDLKEIYKLMYLYHVILSDLELSSPDLDEICKRLYAYKIGAKLTGAGCGGDAVALCLKTENLNKVLKAKLGDDYQRHFETQVSGWSPVHPISLVPVSVPGTFIIIELKGTVNIAKELKRELNLNESADEIRNEIMEKLRKIIEKVVGEDYKNIYSMQWAADTWRLFIEIPDDAVDIAQKIVNHSRNVTYQDKSNVLLPVIGLNYGRVQLRSFSLGDLSILTHRILEKPIKGFSMDGQEITFKCSPFQIIIVDSVYEKLGNATKSKCKHILRNAEIPDYEQYNPDIYMIE